MTFYIITNGRLGNMLFSFSGVHLDTDGPFPKIIIDFIKQ